MHILFRSSGSICQPCSSSPDCGPGEFCKKGFDEVSGGNYAYCTKTCNPAAPDAPQCPGGSICAASGICSNPDVGGICEVAVSGCSAKGGKKGKKGGKKGGKKKGGKKGGKKGKKGKRK